MLTLHHLHKLKTKQAEKLKKLKEIILDTVAKRGKQHNPVTGSGGMLIGTIEKIGPAMEGKNGP